MPKVFLSYSTKNEAFVTDLYRRLTRDDVSCFLDKESIAWGANWVIALEQGLEECDTVKSLLQDIERTGT